MDKARMTARQRLKFATKFEFDTLLENANLTPLQDKIIRLHIAKNYSVCKIAMAVNLCESSIKKYLSRVYDKINLLS